MEKSKLSVSLGRRFGKTTEFKMKLAEDIIQLGESVLSDGTVRICRLVLKSGVVDIVVIPSGTKHARREAKQ